MTASWIKAIMMAGALMLVWALVRSYCHDC